MHQRTPLKLLAASALLAVAGAGFALSMAESRKAEIPNFTGGEAASITTQGNPYIFRTSFTQATAMPKVARYISDQAKITGSRS